MDGEKVLGQFDGHMLKTVIVQDLHRVQVLGERMRRGKREILVHWDGYAQSADEWVGARQVDEEG